MKKQRVPVYVISLAQAAERRRAIAEHLERLGIEFEIVDGVDGRAMSDEERRAVAVPGVALTPGMIGCNLSHVRLSRRLLESDHEMALFLEDDARVSPAVAQLLREGIDAPPFDICFLDSDDRNEHGPVYYDMDDFVDLPGGFRAHRLSDGPQRTHALLVTRAATERRLAHIYPIRHCIDVYDGLPFKLAFFSIISPKAAWLSEHAIESATSPTGTSGGSTPRYFSAFRRTPLYFKLKDRLTLKSLRRRVLLSMLKAEHVVDPGRRWSPLPLAGRILGD